MVFTATLEVSVVVPALSKLICWNPSPPGRPTVHGPCFLICCFGAWLVVGKRVALPSPPPRCRDRVHSLYLPACHFLTPGDPGEVAPGGESEDQPLQSPPSRSGSGSMTGWSRKDGPSAALILRNFPRLSRRRFFVGGPTWEGFRGGRRLASSGQGLGRHPEDRTPWDFIGETNALNARHGHR